MNTSPNSTESGFLRALGRRWPLVLMAVVLAVIYARSGRSVPASFTWMDDLDGALARAAESGQPVLIDFYTTWCGPCKTMDRQVFARTDVAEALARWVPVHLDADKETAAADRFAVQGYPTIIALSPKGVEVARFVGTLPADKFIAFVQAVEARIAAAGPPASDAP